MVLEFRLPRICTHGTAPIHPHPPFLDTLELTARWCQKALYKCNTIDSTKSTEGVTRKPLPEEWPRCLFLELAVGAYTDLGVRTRRPGGAPAPWCGCHKAAVRNPARRPSGSRWSCMTAGWPHGTPQPPLACRRIVAPYLSGSWSVSNRAFAPSLPCCGHALSTHRHGGGHRWLRPALGSGTTWSGERTTLEHH